MYPEVEQYIAARSAADEVYAAAPRQDWDKPHTPETCAVCAQEAAYAAAWEALKDSQEPLVRWIAENCWDYASEALTALKALPAPMSELDALASRNGWCGTWESFKTQARQAGVLPAETAGQEVSA